ncbi:MULTISPECIES: LPXTG cell wall anchor domain-containing protein [unclassified Streptomyces]|uniref:LPXTG cell wall anchor domain-containing protein n=1 Tax=unclassified Streptomyces TaxID=2593676 RepID=UPI003679D38C
MRRSLISAGALVAAMAGSLVLAPAASASERPNPEFNQQEQLPISAGEYEKGDCPPVASDKDGWHFVLPGSGKDDSAVFTKLTVEFKPGGIQTVTVFGPPSDKHAYVASEPGAELISATAEINGELKKNFFNLSHTCPASAKPTPTGTPTTTAPTPTDTPTTGTPTGTPTTDVPTTGTPTTGTPSGTPSESTTPSGTPTTGAPTTGTPGESVSPTSTSSESAGQPAPSASGSSSTGGSAEGDLAETGSSAPVGVLAAVAVALAGAGAFLVSRRRKAQQH